MKSFTHSRLATATLLALITLPATMVRAEIHRSAHAIPGEYIVVLHEDIAPANVAAIANDLSQGQGAVPEEIWTHALNGFFVRMDEEAAELLSVDPAVAFVEENAETFVSATTVSTKIDPACTDPNPANCVTSDNRLWHLDRLDQDSAASSNTFSSCITGSGVTIYVLDTGTDGSHSEFLRPDGTSRVTSGHNSSHDPWPANNPCGGWNVAATGPMLALDTKQMEAQINAGHGTGTASLVAGKSSGVAREATIFPVKIARCDGAKPRYRQRNGYYAVDDLVYDVTVETNLVGKIHKFWKAVKAGNASGLGAVNWTANVDGKIIDGDVEWVEFTPAEHTGTTAMQVAGLDWIAKNYVRPAVVTTSAFHFDSDTDNNDDEDPANVYGPSPSMEVSVRSLLALDIAIIASANNQDGDACRTVPGAFSANNPNGHAADVITVGGTMLINDPESPSHDPSQPVRDRRWSCATPETPSNLCESGSNGGPCVTLFAPAYNLSVASNFGATSYRAREGNSGTSWAAPLVAGVVAGYLQTPNPSLSVLEIRARLIADSRADLDAGTLVPLIKVGASSSRPVGPTANLLLRAGTVQITTHPQNTPAGPSGSTTLSVTQTPSSGITYQWFQVNAQFDLTKKRGAADSVPLAGKTSSSLTITNPTSPTGYWVRVQNCGVADSDIAVVVPRPPAPTNVVATAIGNSVLVTWSAASGVDKYRIERKIAGQPWTEAAVVNSGTLTYTDTPPVTTGMAIYRVLSASGVQYLASTNLAMSVPSNNDIANLDADTYEALAVAPSYINFKAQMLTELRQAANSLAAAAGITTMPYTSGEVLLSALQGATIQDEYLLDLMTKINSVRTNSLVNVPTATWSTAPSHHGLITRTYVEQLRAALQ